MFNFQEMDEGDQAINDPVSPVKAATGPTPTGTVHKKKKRRRDMVDMEIKVEGIIKLMEKKGRNLSKFMISLKQRAVSNTVELGYLMILLHQDYSFLGDENERILIRLTITPTGRIDLTTLESYIKKYSSNQTAPTLSGTFQFIANRIQKKSLGTSLDQFLETRFHWDYNTQIDFEEYMSKMTKVLDLTPEEVRESFEALDVSKQNRIICNELIFTLQTYLKDAKDLNLDLLNLADVIPGYNTMTPRSGFAALLKEVKFKVESKGLTFLSVWNIAKKQGELKKAKEDLKTAILKYVTDVSEELLNEIFKQMPMAMPTKEEYLTFFGEKEQVQKDK